MSSQRGRGRSESGGSAEVATPAPQLGRFEQSDRGEDAGDEAGWGDVEGGVAGGAGGVGDADPGAAAVGAGAPGVEHFVRGPFLDGDVGALAEGPVEGGEGDGDVEGDAVLAGEDGLGVGADLVGDLAGAAEHAIGADDDEVDFAALHEVAGGVVGDDVVGDALLGQFPGGEGGALGAGSGFVAEDVEPAAGGVGGVEGGGCGADIDEGEPAGVAVGEDAGAVGDEGQAVFAEFPAMADVLVGEGFGGVEGLGLLFGDGGGGVEGGEDAAHGVDGVDGGGSGAGEGLEDAIGVALEGGG